MADRAESATGSASQARQVSPWTLLDIPVMADGRGFLCSAEANRQVPFPIERVYWIYGVPNDAHRGCHAHRSVQELVIAAVGEFDVHCDNGVDRQTFRLCDPSRGLLLGSGVWRDLDAFSTGALCLVLASGPYEEGEYIRDYPAFSALSETARSHVPRAD